LKDLVNTYHEQPAQAQAAPAPEGGPQV
jgi:hypothetical protein